MSSSVSIKNILEEDGVYKFTLYNLNVSIANAIRRTILSDIPTIVLDAENSKDNHCNIVENTCRLHNEIIKQRLGCIPVHERVAIKGDGSYEDPLTKKYVVELDVSNETDNMLFVTTEHLRIKNKETNQYLSKEEVQQIFPKNEITQYYIDILRLRPKISNTINGEKIKLSCELAVKTAKMNGMFNVVSKCSYEYSPDKTKQMEHWDKMEKKLKKENDITADEINFQKKNFFLLDAQRHYLKDSFDFVVQSVGVYENKEIIKMACVVLQHKFVEMIKMIDSDIISILQSETTVDYSFDIILENEDYTIGKVLEYYLYNNYFVEEKRLSFCGFKKFHPHDKYSVVRVAFKQQSDKNDVRQCVRKSCVDAQEMFSKIHSLF